MSNIAYNPFKVQTVYKSNGYADPGDHPVNDADVDDTERFTDVIDKTKYEFVDVFVHYEGGDAVDALTIRVYKRETSVFGGGISEVEHDIDSIVIPGAEHGGNKKNWTKVIGVDDGTGYFRLGFLSGGSTTDFDVMCRVALRSRIIV